MYDGYTAYGMPICLPFTMYVSTRFFSMPVVSSVFAVTYFERSSSWSPNPFSARTPIGPMMSGAFRVAICVASVSYATSFWYTSSASLMFDFVQGPSAALHLATAALSAPSCSGLPPVPMPTNQRTRIFPSDVSPPGLDGWAVMSAPVGLGVEDAEGDALWVHAPAITSAAIPSAIPVRQCVRFMSGLLPTYLKTSVDHSMRSEASPPLEPRTTSSVASTTLRATCRGATS